VRKNVASQVIGAEMVSASDGSAFTGSVTCYVTGDGGTQAAGSVGSGACTHEGNGFHTYAPAQAETNYDHIAFTFTGTGAVPATVQVYPAFPQTIDLNTSTVHNAFADALLNRDMSTGTDSGSTTVRTVRQALRFLRNKFAIAAGTLTVYKEDDSTSSWTSALTTSASAEAVTTSDPAGP
jgi:hypothetical protein